MDANTRATVGSGLAFVFVLASSQLAGAADLSVPAGTGAQVGGAVDSAAGAADAANGTSQESMKKMVDDTAKQGENAAKEKAKSAADEAIDAVGSGAGSH
jgi:hypothetical protein